MQSEDHHYKVITQIERDKFIAVCEHGTLHLIWGMVKLGFHIQDFAQLVRFLNQNINVSRGQEVASGPLLVRQEWDDKYKVRVLYVELHLSATEFILFIELGNTALDKLNLDFDALYTSDLDPLHLPKMQYVDPALISYN